MPSLIHLARELLGEPSLFQSVDDILRTRSNTMATSHLNQLTAWYAKDKHPVWYGGFSDEQRDRMVSDDLTAGYSIPAILFSIILAGLCSMALSVLLAL
jgi:hypothetical protein